MAVILGIQACLSPLHAPSLHGWGSRAHVPRVARRPSHGCQLRKVHVNQQTGWRTVPRAYLSTEPNILFEIAKPWWDELTSLMPELSAPQPVVSPLSFVLVDPWGTKIDALNLSSALFALSLFPYLGFLYHLTKSKTCPPVTLFGFYFLLVFVAVTIPAGIYAKLEYQTSLANVDWLHGAAESFLTVTNLLVVVGLQGALEHERASETSTGASISTCSVSVTTSNSTSSSIGVSSNSSSTSSTGGGRPGAGTGAAIDGASEDGRLGPGREAEESVETP